MFVVRFYNGTIIRLGTTFKNIPCYMCDSVCKSFIVKKAKIFSSYVEHFLILAGVRKGRFLNGLCKQAFLKQAFLNCPTRFHD